MGVVELALVGLGLSMDAFAVSLSKGMSVDKLNSRYAAIIALFFGGFQAIMPFLGWLLGKQFEGYISRVDHWVAFGLLAFIGGKMIYEIYQKDRCPAKDGNTLNIKELLILAVATSIDALAVGISFAFLRIPIIPAILLIGIITYVVSFLGVFIGHKTGTKLKSKAELVGGIVLILIGIKILWEHLGDSRNSVNDFWAVFMLYVCFNDFRDIQKSVY